MLDIRADNVDHGCSTVTVEVAPEGTSRGSNSSFASNAHVTSSKPQMVPNVVSVYPHICRICHTINAKELPISPCRCKGTLAFVHLTCLERWLNQSSRSYCELCLYRFNIVQTRRYPCFQSIIIWIRHSSNRQDLQLELLIICLLTLMTIGLITVCIFGTRFFIAEGSKMGISWSWTRGMTSFFVTIVIAGYLSIVYHLMKDQVSLWYQWWKRTVNVRLIMDSPLTQRPSNASTEDVELDNQTTDLVTTKYASVRKSQSCRETRL